MTLSCLVVVVTGASKGIGRAIALRAASDGASVVINYLSDSKGANAVVSEIGSNRAIAVQADISKVDEVDRLIDATVSQFGKIDILIPNAAFVPAVDMEGLSEEIFDRSFAVNVKGPCFLAKKAIPFMAPGSRIIFISTDLTESSFVRPDFLLYLATKGAMNQMVRVLARDLAKKDIRVNAVSPGATSTELFNQANSDEEIRRIASFNPFGRIGTPEDTAAAVSLLWGGDSAWINGQVLRVNGGTI
ncbi:putative oxidoreductase [Talaromyces pinophilus]|nr:putative oxidoreductase [Talaromyces pinophilus]